MSPRHACALQEDMQSRYIPKREVTHLSPEYQGKDVEGFWEEELWMPGLELHIEQEKQRERGMDI